MFPVEIFPSKPIQCWMLLDLILSFSLLPAQMLRYLLFASLFSFAVVVRIISRSSCLLSYPLLFVYMTRSCLGRYQFCSFCQNYTSFAGSNLTKFLSFLFLSSLLVIIPELKGIFAGISGFPGVKNHGFPVTFPCDFNPCRIVFSWWHLNFQWFIFHIRHILKPPFWAVEVCWIPKFTSLKFINFPIFSGGSPINPRNTWGFPKMGAPQ